MTLHRSLRERSSGSEESQLSAVIVRGALRHLYCSGTLAWWARAKWSVRQDKRRRAYRQHDRPRLVLNPPLERAYAPTQRRHFPWHFLRFVVETLLRTRHSELDSNQLPGRIADARHAIFDSAEAIPLNRQAAKITNCMMHSAPCGCLRTWRGEKDPQLKPR
jgi:hypothetical protein